MTARMRRVNESLREVLSEGVGTLNDPRIGMVTVTAVETSPDLRQARVFVSVLGTDDERTATLAALRSAAGFIRHHLRPRLRMRQIPDLEFRDDRSMEHAEQIGRTLRELELARAAPRAATEPEGRE